MFLYRSYWSLGRVSIVSQNPSSDRSGEVGTGLGLIVDMGILRVEVIGAKNLMAGDRSGKSDVSWMGKEGESS
jgi:hypothetical protein